LIRQGTNKNNLTVKGQFSVFSPFQFCRTTRHAKKEA
jgi:hypothetical protein